MNKDTEQQERIDQLLHMPFRRFVDLCIEWKEDTNPDISKMKLEQCPIHRYSMIRGRCMRTIAGIELCPICNNPMCPACGNHWVEQLSRVTGYLSAVSGWNAAKRQELIDRTRYDMKKTVGVGR